MPALAGHLDLTCARDANGRSYLREQSFSAPFHVSKPYWDGEALLLKVFDSRYPEGIFGTPHTAADPVNTPDNARNRNSLEVRVIAFS